ncbi:allantoinase PuuE [Bradyrhizobium sp. U87765 SZCCT0131]|uniref:allantoinase PuuE n=1 Tax=unclassified Bradyrhizobium TaxID=2631580 RepID=UPI001BA5D889|nr:MULTISPECIES: allantoinase PuuE [unclassified Bradyrhizobium]MBR1221724.1 allantoinase PuuE [Bradyrhizobium sp. U87765 SZCCT0131]MBR1264353.1 allantoinase PuuE [Bradyrhizobium sp. U87765 SZCCT0134]MBR1304740.1 allantoinase PuuE [Bradyrhizobium sp. U87765 SZCCT0110]MBR1322403.1 allantoinase PuuE [Bradyrhizobium sp. U87765 SZCCT0109]MBR1346669.1 allantoinase PuuE [Bradyrhizobium sp. U87765 SZCCT0048]
MTDTTDYPRDLAGYGRTVPQAAWPGGARIAVQIVINYEEGGENCILHGDAASEAFLSEIVGAQPWPGQRHMNMESIYEYGSRAGFWRLWRLFTQRNIPVTVYGVATALARNPAAVVAMKEAGWEIASHGYKWIEYKDMPAAAERDDLLRAIALHREVTGMRPTGWYLGRCSEHTTRLVMEEGGFLYSSDSYADDLPYWIEGPRGPHLIVPYTLDANDMRFATAQGFNTGDQFFTYLKDSFDVLYAEGETAPKVLSIGLHCRLIGRPGRIAALMRFLDYVASHQQVWFTRRIDIARHWLRHHPPVGGLPPSRMSLIQFVETFGDIFEHSPEIAEAAYRGGLRAADDVAEGLHASMVAAMRAQPAARQRALIDAHPDLAGRLALAKQLTEDSTREQGGAGLDRLTPAELAEFTALNDRYRARFGFPYILAVKGRDKADILANFKSRIDNSVEAEFDEALRQIERIALLRLRDRLP